MKKASVVLVGGNVASSEILEMLYHSLEQKKEVMPMPILGHGKLTGVGNDIIRNAVKNSDVVVTGLTDTEPIAREEIEAVKAAIEFGKPLGWVSDTFDVFRRPWFEEFREHVKFLFVVDEEEKGMAKKLYPNAEVVASGVPFWEKKTKSRFSRNQVRGILGVKNEETAILCSGVKSVSENEAFLSEIVSALQPLTDRFGPYWKILFSTHPGDQEYKANPAVYDSFAKASSIPIRIIAKSEMSTPEAIPGVEYIIDNPGSFIGISGAFQRKKVICYFRPGARDGLEKAIAVRVWRPCDRGAMYELNDARKFQQAFNADWTAYLRNQELYFPVPPKEEDVLKIMSDTIFKYIPAQV